MDAAHIHDAYGDYWTAYTSTSSTLTQRDPTRFDVVRSKALSAAVAHSSQPAWLFFSPNELTRRRPPSRTRGWAGRLRREHVLGPPRPTSIPAGWCTSGSSTPSSRPRSQSRIGASARRCRRPWPPHQLAAMSSMRLPKGLDVAPAHAGKIEVGVTVLPTDSRDSTSASSRRPRAPGGPSWPAGTRLDAEVQRHCAVGEQHPPRDARARASPAGRGRGVPHRRTGRAPPPGRHGQLDVVEGEQLHLENLLADPWPGKPQ